MSIRNVQLELDDIILYAEVEVEPYRPAVLYGPNMGPAEGGIYVTCLEARILDRYNVLNPGLYEQSGQVFPLETDAFPGYVDMIVDQVQDDLNAEAEAKDD